MYKNKKYFAAFLPVVLFVSFFLVAPKADAQNTLSTSIDSATLVALTNADRAAHHLSQVTASPVLEAAARKKAEDMIAGGYFSHNSPSGVTPWHWFKDAGYAYYYAGENLAIDFGDSHSVEKAWMNSPLHRQNILNGNYTEVGIVAIKGMYQGRETTYVVQLFGKPIKTVVKKPTKPLAVLTKKSIKKKAKV